MIFEFKFKLNVHEIESNDDDVMIETRKDHDKCSYEKS